MFILVEYVTNKIQAKICQKGICKAGSTPWRPYLTLRTLQALHFPVR